MADFQPWLARSNNLDQITSFGATVLAKAMAGGASEQRRRAAKIGEDKVLPGSRARSYVADSQSIITKLRECLAVIERNQTNGLIKIPMVGSFPRSRSAKSYFSRSGVLPPATRRTAGARTTQGRASRRQKHFGWTLDVVYQISDT